MNRLNLENIEDNFGDYSLKIDATICGLCRHYKIELHHKKLDTEVIKVELEQVSNNFTIKIRKGIISDYLEYTYSDINSELHTVLSKVVTK